MIAEIENAIQARLKAAGELAADAGGLGYAYRTLESYPIEFDAYLKEKPILNYPAAWVAFGGFTRMDEVGPGSYEVLAVFVLVVASENLRNEKAQRHGAAGKVGSYQLALDAIALLGGQDLGLDIGRLSPDGLRSVRPSESILERKLSLYAIPFSTRYILERAEPSDLGDFETFHANWDVPPFGGVDGDPDDAGVQLPADDTADATDHLQLPTEEA